MSVGFFAGIIWFLAIFFPLVKLSQLYSSESDHLTLFPEITGNHLLVIFFLYLERRHNRLQWANTFNVISTKSSWVSSE